MHGVTVIDDAAQSPGLTLMFGSLARAYGVKVAQEWTAPNSNADMSAQAAQWVSNYAMTLPQSGGEDFFIHDGTTKDVIGFPIYTGFVGTLQGMSGSYPQQPAAVYIDYSLAFGNPNGGNLLTPEDAISNVWLGDQAGFAVVTSQEVANGAVNLSQFKAILPMNGVDATLRSYQSGGGTLLTSGSQLAQFAPAYAHLDNSGSLQTVPAVASNHQSASITLAVINPTANYNGSVTVSPGAVFDMANGMFYDSGGIFSGGGTRQMTSGILTLRTNVLNGLSLDGGTVLLGPGFQQAGVITNLSLSGAVLAGVGDRLLGARRALALQGLRSRPRASPHRPSRSAGRNRNPRSARTGWD